MKRSLLASTAVAGLIAVAAHNPAHAQFEVSVGGDMVQFFSFSDQDVDDIHPVNQFSDVEIEFEFSQTLDNGIEIGGEVQLEGETDGDTIDEQYLFVEGSFGSVIIGSENSAGYRMNLTAPTVGGLGINSGTVSAVIVDTFGLEGRSPQGSTNIEPFDSNDAFNVGYYSPRFAGVQVGISYIPHINDQDSDALFNTETQPTDGVSGGINYVGAFGAVDVEVSFTAAYAAAPDAVAANEDFFGISAGLVVGFGGFAVGGAYAETFDGQINNRNFEGRGFHVGGTYETGPWGVGIQYFQGDEEDDTTVNGEDEYRAVQGSATYALGPGVDANFDVGYAEFESETGADNDGVYGVLSISAGF